MPPPAMRGDSFVAVVNPPGQPAAGAAGAGVPSAAARLVPATASAITAAMASNMVIIVRVSGIGPPGAVWRVQPDRGGWPRGERRTPRRRGGVDARTRRRLERVRARRVRSGLVPPPTTTGVT